MIFNDFQRIKEFLLFSKIFEGIPKIFKDFLEFQRFSWIVCRNYEDVRGFLRNSTDFRGIPGFSRILKKSSGFKGFSTNSKIFDDFRRIPRICKGFKIFKVLAWPILTEPSPRN